MRPVAKYRMVPLALALALVCLGAAAQAQEIVRCGALPAAVAATRDAIAAAADAGDLAALAALADPDDFTYSFGGDSDPVAYWQSMLAEEGTDIAAMIVGVLDAGCTQEGDGTEGFFVWPAAAMLDYPDLGDDEIAALQTLYGGDLESWYIEGFDVGYYVGWRLYIAADGRWTAFVAGD